MLSERGRRRGLAGAVLMGLLLSTAAKAADPIRIYAAGSLSGVLPDLIAASGLPAGAVAAPVFGPAGLLRQRLLAGEAADVFASADLAQPRAVAAGAGAPVVPFARNRMCVVTPARLGLTADTLLDRLLTPELRLATSTPVADPGGDYALAVFARADALHPGAAAILTAKALLLLGGPGTMPQQPGQSPPSQQPGQSPPSQQPGHSPPSQQPGHSPAAAIFLGDHADALLYYCSGAAAVLREAPGLVSIPLPDALEVEPIYGLTVLSARPEAAQLALFMVSERGQAILAQGGLLPLTP